MLHQIKERIQIKHLEVWMCEESMNKKVTWAGNEGGLGLELPINGGAISEMGRYIQRYICI